MIARRDRISADTLKTVAVLGAGAWGTALALAFERVGAEVRLWTWRSAHADAMAAEGQNGEHLSGVAFPERVRATASMEEALDGAGLILLATPSDAAITVAEAAARVGKTGAPIVICSKGLGDRGALLSECIGLVWQGPVLVLSGPSFADEVADQLPTILTLAGPAPLAARLADYYSNGDFVLCPSNDVAGVQVAAVFKNVAAILCGVCDGVGLGANARAALMSEAMREAAGVVRAMGGSVDTLLGPAGFGDFALTCTDVKSRNYSFGRRLGQGLATVAPGQTIEGAANVASLVRLTRRLGVDAPLAAAVSGLLVGRCRPREAVEAAFAWRRDRAFEAARAA
ncbi:MAG: NAD(P)H-dependent glycerol-3-phosphate dehydrogenase [Hyphomonadaceae bacterium]|nr:NAD(P)H-dependent glycerol-3-phosphate dehydrogenase [Hyphomonadaceae bacterium]